jgi:hypothetical protein
MAPAEPEDDAAGASRSLTWRLRRIALVLAVGMRLLVRLSRERSSRPDRHTSRRGGSIGSELCRQIYRFGPAELLMLDRNESALLDSRDVILTDVRDAETINAIFKERRPDVVFHGSTPSLAAADLRNSDDSPPGAPGHGKRLPCTSASF